GKFFVDISFAAFRRSRTAPGRTTTAMSPSLERAFRDPVSAMSWFRYKIRPGRHDVHFSE
ncbi:hypothetical protein, partial [Amycolatopsis mediterranei]|uniref:hypothetical protein n=1 Tax=Amycolatopsis mediterranei TaxID=33910 RepID=UPI003329301E